MCIVQVVAAASWQLAAGSEAANVAPAVLQLAADFVFDFDWQFLEVLR